MFRPLMLAIIRLFEMSTYQLVIQVYGLLGGGWGGGVVKVQDLIL
jgi:hypothetical protein